MKQVTMKEFCELEGYSKHDNSTKNLGCLDSDIGCSISYISKLYNSYPMGSTRGKTWLLVSDFVRNKGYELIKLNPIDNMIIKKDEENKKLKEENVSLKTENELLRNQLKKYNGFKRLAIMIANDDKKICKVKRRKKDEYYTFNR